MQKIIVRRESQSLDLSWPAELHPVLQRVYQARAIRSSDELEHSLRRLVPYQSLRGIDEAVKLLAECLAQQARILVVADFDADGATSCAVAVRALKLMGAQHVGYLVPNRFEYGYGLSPEIVAVAAQQQPQLMITVDNGISSLEGVCAARALGIKVLITDHHLAGAQLPEAEAIVNPNQPDDHFPSKALAGVGVIFYVMLALRAYLREQGWFSTQNIAEPNLAALLDLVALGTVADVVPLDYNNRILVGQGLARIRAGECCVGIKALLEVAGRSCAKLSTADLGFAVAPRLNAAGRLEDMSLGISCLLTDDLGRARAMALELDRLNQERRVIEAQMQNEALAALTQAGLGMDNEQANTEVKLPVGLCLYHASWHQGVVGLVASRIKEKYHRPVIAFAQTHEGELKGSARSIEGVHIRDVLDAIAARHPGLIAKFGGHAMAAGLTLQQTHFADFRAAFDEEVRQHVQEEELRGIIYSDGELSAQELTLNLAELLRLSGPWGQGFPEPMFDGVFEVMNWRTVGERHLKLVLRPPGARQTVEAIAFNSDFSPSSGRSAAAMVRIAYRLEVNEFRGVRNPQLVVEHIEPC